MTEPSGVGSIIGRANYSRGAGSIIGRENYSRVAESIIGRENLNLNCVYCPIDTFQVI